MAAPELSAFEPAWKPRSHRLSFASNSRMSESLIELRGISKSFPGVQALKNVNLTIGKGEILCVLGEKGAGKSTLMKILTGVYPDYQGAIFLDGQQVKFQNTRDAFNRGISIVFQEFNRCPNL